jgi:hypothetical protein
VGEQDSTPAIASMLGAQRVSADLPGPVRDQFQTQGAGIGIQTSGNEEVVTSVV